MTSEQDKQNGTSTNTVQNVVEREFNLLLKSHSVKKIHITRGGGGYRIDFWLNHIEESKTIVTAKTKETKYWISFDRLLAGLESVTDKLPAIKVFLNHEGK